jgi:hypothetical protein
VATSEQKKPAAVSPAEKERSVPAAGSVSARHLRAGWWGLFVYLSFGIALEMLHGFKIGFYLDVTNHTRRLMWTLAHAHGTLLALVNIAFALTLPLLTTLSAKLRNLASVLLLGALVLLPGGFFLGGLAIYSGDPGLGIILVPVGALFLLVAVFLIARCTTGPGPE